MDTNMKYVALIATMALIACASSKKNTSTAATTPVAAAPAAATASPAKQDKGASLMSCTRGEDTRLLQVALKDKGCVLDYTKAGKEAAVASSSKGTEHCDKSKEKIAKKLEAAGFACK
jgi:hypothetical protein